MGYSPDPTTKAAVVPIRRAAAYAYAFDSEQHGIDLFDLKVPGLALALETRHPSLGSHAIPCAENLGCVHQRWTTPHVDANTEHLFQFSPCALEFVQGLDMKSDAA